MNTFLLGLIAFLLLLTNGPSLKETNDLLREIKRLLETIEKRGRNK